MAPLDKIGKKYKLEYTLREFPAPQGREIWWNHPIHEFTEAAQIGESSIGSIAASLIPENGSAAIEDIAARFIPDFNNLDLGDREKKIQSVGSLLIKAGFKVLDRRVSK